MSKEFIVTEDGSHTIYLPEMNEHYHSVHGAVEESLHIYIGEGLLQTTSRTINILEIGFGTGLNAYLTFCIATQLNLTINYTALEKFPLDKPEYSQLNYPRNVFPEYSDIFELMHQSDWNSGINISDNFVLKKIEVDLLTFRFNKTPEFDLVYYDAFAPSKQPEMWSDEILQTVALSVKLDGIFVTYCAKGTVRRALNSAGFMMERIPGPTGKKEILRGKKSL